jgi:uncharacterized tellurite resistance protein B-like protein
VIILTSGLVELLSENELPYIVGHEIGHHLFLHERYPQVGPEMSDAQRLNVLSLNRAAEISADRVGFICSPSLEDSFRSILKIASGLSDRHLRIDLTEYLEQLRELRDLSGDPDAIYYTHPMFPLRVRSLLWFSMSEPYYYWTDNPNRAPMSKEQLDERVSADFAVLCGIGLELDGHEALRAVKIWSVLKLLSIDERLTKDEQRVLAHVIGQDEARSAIRLLQADGPNASVTIEHKLAQALEAAADLPEKHRLELLNELERVASASGGDEESLLTELSRIAKALAVSRAVEIRPWALHA